MSVAYTQRKRWSNHTGNEAVEPLRIYKPGRLDELQEIVATAASDGATVRAVGSGHSWSDVALTEGYLVETHRLARPLAVDCLRPDWDGEPLERVEAGMRIRQLNQVLAKRERALLQNWAATTPRRSPAWSRPPLTGRASRSARCPTTCARSTSSPRDARVHRVEPAAGPTDPAAFAREHPDWELHKDDEAFAAAVVGMGCMGVVYAITLAVTDAYWLTEIARADHVARVRADLPAALAGNRHLEVYINPYPGRDGEHRCIVCTRNPADPRRPRTLDRLRRHWWSSCSAG